MRLERSCAVSVEVTGQANFLSCQHDIPGMPTARFFTIYDHRVNLQIQCMILTLHPDTVIVKTSELISVTQMLFHIIHDLFWFIGFAASAGVGVVKRTSV